MINKTAIISGITGQDGAYLAQLLLNHDYTVIGLYREKFPINTFGLSYLEIKDRITLLPFDLLDKEAIVDLFNMYQPSEFYNLAAQSSVYQSFKSPIATFEFNTISVFNLLETIKVVDPNIRFYQASSSEMFGRVNDLPITEDSILHPLSPYAISKAAAHFTCIHYRESYHMHVSCGILFNHESYLRQSNFFVKKIISESIRISKRKQDTLWVGNIDIKRDFGFAPNYVQAMFLMMQQQNASDYLICSGQSTTLRAIIYYIFSKLGIPETACQVSNELYRPSEIEDMFGDNTKAKLELNWQYNLTIFETLDLLLEEELKNDI
ncbi:MAG: GDP-mannose 4,6-dehydratase [Burkholderiales bacterium]|nr:GDP-mannose 4,6-dehydratase [Flavobacterium sp.]